MIKICFGGNMKKYFMPLIILSIILSLSGCSTSDNNVNKNVIKLNSEKMILAVTETQILIADYPKTSKELKWQSDDENIAEVGADGLVKAKKSGSCKIIVTDGVNKVSCEVEVYDSVVCSSFDAQTYGFGILRFNKIQAAVDKGGLIAVLNGNYDELIEASKKIELIGIGDVQLRGILGTEISVKNIIFSNNNAPEKYTIYAKNKLKVEDCVFQINNNKPEGGYAIFSDNQTKLVEILSCQFVNYRYSIYLYQSDADVKIISNKITNSEVGIGVNIKPIGSMFDNYRAKGIIKENLFFECKTSTEFLYAGGSYTGDLNFKDYSKTDIKQ